VRWIRERLDSRPGRFQAGTPTRRRRMRTEQDFYFYKRYYGWIVGS
jgi:hypothetical protein